MTKFASVDDSGFVAVYRELRRWIKEIGATRKIVMYHEVKLPAGQDQRAKVRVPRQRVI